MTAAATSGLILCHSHANDAPQFDRREAKKSTPPPLIINHQCFQRQRIQTLSASVTIKESCFGIFELS